MADFSYLPSDETKRIDYVLVFTNIDEENGKLIGSNLVKRGIQKLKKDRAVKKYDKENGGFDYDDDIQFERKITEKYQTFEETRKIFKETLEKQTILVDHVDSDLYKNTLGFHLVHLQGGSLGISDSRDEMQKLGLFGLIFR